jgi:hypothetical protein
MQQHFLTCHDTIIALFENQCLFITNIKIKLFSVQNNSAPIGMWSNTVRNILNGTAVCFSFRERITDGKEASQPITW